MNKNKNIPMAQEMLSMSLGPFLMSSSYGTVSITCTFHSHPSASSCTVIVHLILCPCCHLVVVVLIVGLCPHCCCCCHLSPCYWCQCCPLLLLLPSWLCFFFIVASLSLLCQLLISTLWLTAAHSSGMGVSVLSWCCFMVITEIKPRKSISSLKIKEKTLPRAWTTCCHLGPMWLVCSKWWQQVVTDLWW